MRHFAFLDDIELERLFLLEPERFDAAADRDLLAVALGATLYSPATRPRLAEDIAKRAQAGVVSTVVCLEDSVPDDELQAAERNAIDQLRRYSAGNQDGPLIFVRVRAVEQIATLVDGLGEHVGVLAGFVLPKFTAANGERYLQAVARASSRTGHPLRVMPVLESPEVTFVESRRDALVAIRCLLDAHREQVLAVRIGATDLSATFGLRRTRDVTVYDVRVIADVIADIVNIFGRDGAGYVISGPVWEYFSGTERMFKPQLRVSPFIEHDERRLRARLIAGDLDGLIREVTLDRVNGLTGKTVIHPSHVAAVHALAVVSHEAYLDATDVLGTRAGGGVASSAYGNKMNESKPHTAWAHRTMLRARAFGVAREDVSFVDLLGASLRL
ncbi:MAG: HpcH/HpaI aldolase/citrate lyase family protein [Jatrophihabitantaceae bacterium]